jgi:Zn-finger nucleic acid-binding protein
MADRSGVEIDYCPKCRGVWLDRGELDKIIDRAAPQAQAAATAPAPQPAPPPPPAYGHPPQPVYPPPRGGHDRDERDEGYRRDDGHYRKKRRESFLGDLFDF